MNLRSFDLLSQITRSNTFALSNARELFLNRIPTNHFQVLKEKEKVFSRRSRAMTAKKYTKKGNARAELLF